MARISFDLNDKTKAAVKATLAPVTIEEWAVEKLRSMAVHADLVTFSAARTKDEEEQRLIDEAQAFEAERQRLIMELEA